MDAELVHCDLDQEIFSNKLGRILDMTSVRSSEMLTSLLIPMFFGITMFLGLTTVVNGQEKRLVDIVPPDVYEHVNLVRIELEYLRATMGRPKDETMELPVSDAEPREVFFQALTLYRKADRLCFEQSRTRVKEPAPPQGKILPGHVYGAVDAALERLRRIKKQLRLDRQFTKNPTDLAKTPSDVFRSIVQANRQLNLMLEQQFAPGDVFQQVTLAIGYTERLIEQFPGEDSIIPEPPRYEANKMPAHVYRRLLRCFATIRKITEQSGKQVLKLGQLDEAQIERAAPSDVYDVASLVVSELVYIQSELPAAAPPRKVYYPGQKFPSDVFQRVGILEKQLAQLERLVEVNPDWLLAITPTMTR